MTDPYSKVRQVEAKHQHDIDMLAAELRSVLRSKRSAEWKYEQSVRLLDELVAYYAPVSPCKRGCAFCCHQAVSIFKIEAERIAKYSKRQMQKPPGFDFLTYTRNEHSKYIEKYEGKACPFLRNNECSVYEVRPLACRGHLSLDNDALNCDTVNRPGAKVPYLRTHPWIQNIGVSIDALGQTVGDIREFFQEGK